VKVSPDVCNEYSWVSYLFKEAKIIDHDLELLNDE
jgi:hypothetical protein